VIKFAARDQVRDSRSSSRLVIRVTGRDKDRGLASPGRKSESDRDIEATQAELSREEGQPGELPPQSTQAVVVLHLPLDCWRSARESGSGRNISTISSGPGWSRPGPNRLPKLVMATVTALRPARAGPSPPAGPARGPDLRLSSSSCGAALCRCFCQALPTARAALPLSRRAGPMRLPGQAGGHDPKQCALKGGTF
jgi:hypothetical protein